VILELYLHTFR